jgi:hypothetical protein
MQHKSMMRMGNRGGGGGGGCEVGKTKDSLF